MFWLVLLHGSRLKLEGKCQVWPLFYQMKAVDLFLSFVLFTMLCMVGLAFETFDEPFLVTI